MNKILGECASYVIALWHEIYQYRNVLVQEPSAPDQPGAFTAN